MHISGKNSCYTYAYVVIRANKHVHATQLPLVWHANAREEVTQRCGCAADSVRLLGLTVHPSVQLANVHSTIDDRPSSSGFDSCNAGPVRSTVLHLPRTAVLLLACLDRAVCTRRAAGAGRANRPGCTARTGCLLLLGRAMHERGATRGSEAIQKARPIAHPWQQQQAGAEADKKKHRQDRRSAGLMSCCRDREGRNKKHQRQNVSIY